jgi:hypothetical protein
MRVSAHPPTTSKPTGLKGGRVCRAVAVRECTITGFGSECDLKNCTSLPCTLTKCLRNREVLVWRKHSMACLVSSSLKMKGEMRGDMKVVLVTAWLKLCFQDPQALVVRGLMRMLRGDSIMRVPD